MKDTRLGLLLVLFCICSETSECAVIQGPENGDYYLDIPSEIPSDVLKRALTLPIMAERRDESTSKLQKLLKSPVLRVRPSMRRLVNTMIRLRTF